MLGFDGRKIGIRKKACGTAGLYKYHICKRRRHAVFAFSGQLFRRRHFERSPRVAPRILPKDPEASATRRLARIASSPQRRWTDLHRHRKRFSYKYFLGYREDRTGLLGGALLPRRIANFYSLAVGGSRLGLTRTLCGDTNGYLEVLDSHRAGFSSPILRTGGFHES